LKPKENIFAKEGTVEVIIMCSLARHQWVQ
ncbi:MAG: hypothetical protein ACI9LN_002765, partial [Saprospiraceae bacterium]